MAQAPARAYPAETLVDRGQLARPTVQAPPVTPGKVAMWLFLATEVMFFTGLIGTYIVLRAGSPPGSYSNLYPPGTDLAKLQEMKGVEIDSVGDDHERVIEAIREATGQTEAQVEATLHSVPHALVTPLKADAAAKLAEHLESLGAKAEVESLETFPWPQPYHPYTNPLSIDLTAVNTFILICSSVTMVLALSAIQRGDQAKLKLFLLATVLIGSVFLGVQVYEYYQLSTGHHHPIGISLDHHFRPSSSLFGSCFYVMTGFHGAHVAGGVILLSCILIAALRGRYSRANHSSVELAGLYWHFVDLVWIILFTVVYLI
jgi:heme/copper-type cytochrome/quinol oxidase subunit 3